jgi:hypothetical protein
VVDNPIKQDGLYLSKIHYYEKDLIIQSPKLRILSCNEDTIDVKITDSFKDFLDEYDQIMISTVSDKSADWFSKELTKTKVAQIYKPSNIKCEHVNTASFKVDENVKVYSRDKELTVDCIEKDMEVILLIHASYLVFYKSNCIPYFNSLQIKIKEKKPNHDFREIEETSKKVAIKLNLEEFEFI